MTEETKIEIIDKLIAIAKTEVGNTENGGNNKGEAVVKYQKSTWLKPGAWAWCAAFMCYIFEQWVKDAQVQKSLDIIKPVIWRCRDASAFGWIAWAKKRELTITDEKELAKKGDIVVFDFSHIGLVIQDQLKPTDKIVTIEGNTEPNKTQRDGTKDGVYIMKRSKTLVKAYIRIV